MVKNVTSPNIEIKKLVYIYILHYAESEPDTALLAINGIQKSLTDQNPQVRALALRTMAGIRVQAISQIVSLAIKRACGDMSPYVRKAAALAIPKCYRLDPNTLPQLLEYLSVFLGDKQYYVAGAAVLAFTEICSDRIDLIHKHYRSLVRKLVDMDEWSQIAALRLMTIYARKCFPRRTQRIKKNNKAKGFYDDDSGSDSASPGEEVIVTDPDLELLLKSALPLLQSRNSAVIVDVARCYFYLSPDSYLSFAIGPLISLLRGPSDIQYPALHSILQICLARPDFFTRYATHFLIRATDQPQLWRLKLELLTIIFPYCESNIKALILNELEHFSRSSSDAELVRESVQAIGRCAAHSDSHTSNRCLHLLLTQIHSSSPSLVAESLTVIRHLIQRDPNAHIKTVIRLAKNLDTLTNPQARASIIWLVGEFAGLNWPNNIAADVLRILIRGFAEESEAAKLQILLLGAKVYVHHLNQLQTAPGPKTEGQSESTEGSAGLINQEPEDEPGGFRDNSTNSSYHSSPESTDYEPLQQSHQGDRITPLWKYLLNLSRYDTSYDLRDRMRVYKSLLSNPTSIQLASLLLLAPKPVPHTPSPSEGRRGFVIGTASLVVGDVSLRGHEEIPEWVESGKEPDPKLRNEDEGATGRREYVAGRVVPAGEMLDSALQADTRKVNADGGVGKQKTLDDWLDEGDHKEENGSEAEESETETEEEGSEEETSEEGDEEEESSDSGNEKGRLMKGG